MGKLMERAAVRGGKSVETERISAKRGSATGHYKICATPENQA